MGQTYSEGENMIAAQMAYLDFDGFEGMDMDTIMKTIEDRYNSNPNPDKILESQMKSVEAIKEIAKKTGAEGWKDWTVQKVCNDNDNGGSGYYGAFIETGKDSETGKKNGMIVSRGTEPDVGAERLYADLVENDLGFLDGDGTTQEKRAAKFMEDIWYEYGDQYEGFDLAGHSLGGHLAMYMAITAPIAMRNKINHITSYDGPGFSDEFIKHYEQIIAEMSGKMTHYEYTIIGSLLNALPGVDRQIITSDADSFPDTHSLKNLSIDKGQVVPGDPSTIMKFTQWLSEFLDGDLNELAFLEFIAKFLGPFVYVPVHFVKKLCDLLKTLAAVFREAREIMKKVGEFIDDIKYRWFKPKVSGDYEISISAINSIQNDITRELKAALNSARDARSVLNSIRSSWTGCSWIKSKIRSNISDIEFDIAKLKNMLDVLDFAKKTYSAADTKVEGLFA